MSADYDVRKISARAACVSSPPSKRFVVLATSPPEVLEDVDVYKRHVGPCDPFVAEDDADIRQVFRFKTPQFRQLVACRTPEKQTVYISDGFAATTPQKLRAAVEKAKAADAKGAAAVAAGLFGAFARMLPNGTRNP